MSNKEYLNEEKYQKASKKIFFVGIGIILLGVVIAVFMIVPKLIGGNEVSEEELQQQLSQLKPALENRYAELESKGVEESRDYKDEEGYEMFLIDIALDPTHETCESSTRYSDNDTTREYCKVKAQLHDINDSFKTAENNVTLFKALAILIFCSVTGAGVIMTAKRREIAAFNAQQIMPVAQEGIEKMAPSAGTVAKEISKGIKEGLKDDQE